MHPILFTIFGFQVHTFGVMLILAFFAGLGLARLRAERLGFTAAQVTDIGFWLLIWGVIGARVIFIVQELPYYLHHVGELLSFKFEGLTSFGSVIFGFGYLWIWSRRHDKPLLGLLDVFAPAMLLGQAVGRVGCLMNGCCFGGACPTDLPWGIHVAGTDLLHHPAQIYESLMDLIGLGVLLFLDKRGLRRGQAFSLFLILFGVSRFIYEFWRAGTEAQVNAGLASSSYLASSPITDAQAVAALMVIGGIVSYFVFARQEQHRIEGAQPA